MAGGAASSGLAGTGLSGLDVPVSPSIALRSPRRRPLVAGATRQPSQIDELRLEPVAGPAPVTRLSLYHGSFSRRHILSVRQFTRDDLHALFAVAQEMRFLVQRNGTLDVLRGRILCTLFYEESTRTSASFLSLIHI